jgi:hypothetical protein
MQSEKIKSHRASHHSGKQVGKKLQDVISGHRVRVFSGLSTKRTKETVKKYARLGFRYPLNF